MDNPAWKPLHLKTQAKRYEYSRRRRAFLAKNPVDVVLLTIFGEQVKATHIHHIKGRKEHFLNESTWLATTAKGDKWIHEHQDEARQHGWLA